ncbi:hypothetical protein BJY16_004232 [Actinoplanes octamycinicus]|uniref:Uncharacterized protein n=1 Tax=Actinoplanes octamycinicus TaxID=135948 RepID=A0A7W7GYT9_9ACTN|nr:hypothetical protein [Actinoplanes octamycinicus]MBB4740773.1 hypothetical protein [Actinoplanes octamycinicus]GIE61688.1 hypothetical protein Aoc01nite_70900 [Actinoplanes octamycinicus]
MDHRGEDPIDRELEAMAGSAALAREVKDALGRMRGGAAGPELAEMAEDLLAGRVRLRDLATTSVYAGPLMTGVERYRQWEAELTPEQRETFGAQIRARFGADLSDHRHDPIHRPTGLWPDD